MELLLCLCVHRKSPLGDLIHNGRSRRDVRRLVAGDSMKEVNPYSVSSLCEGFFLIVGDEGGLEGSEEGDPIKSNENLIAGYQNNS